MDLVAFGCGRLRPPGGDQRRSTVRLLRAAEMRLKTLGSDAEAQPPAGGGGGGLLYRGGRGGGGRGSPACGAGSALGKSAAVWALAGAGPELSPEVGRGGNGSASTPPGCAGPILTALPWSAGRSGLGRFGDPESPGPRAQEGRVPSVFGGGRAAARRRGARGWEG